MVTPRPGYLRFLGCYARLIALWVVVGVVLMLPLIPFLLLILRGS